MDPSEPRVEYLRWACARRTRLYDLEVDRHARLEAKAAQAFAAAAGAFALLVPMMPRTAPRDASLVIAAAGVTGFVALLVAMWHGYRTVRLRDRAVENPAVFLDDDGTEWESNWSARTRRVRDHLVGLVAHERRSCSDKAEQVRGCQFAASVSVACLMLTALLRIAPEVFR